MVKAYDIAVKKLIEVFTKNIPVFGLQNDSDEGYAEVFSQAGKETKDDKIPFPLISVFREPEIEITDGSMSKRAGTAEGYTWENEAGQMISLVTMRSTLKYTIDVFDVTRAAAEEIALRLYFRLRNNPQITVLFSFEGLEEQISCVCQLTMRPSITNHRANGLDKTQLYKIRFGFDLLNVNIYDILYTDPMELVYHISVRLAEK